MKLKWVLKCLVVIGVIFLSARLVSQIFLFLADKHESREKVRYLKASHLFFPLDYLSAYKFGFLLLKQGYDEKNNEKLERSIHWFRKSIRLNPFFHLSHYHLGKAYLSHNYPLSKHFDAGVSELKQALDIYQDNLFMVKDTARVMLSMWPLLEESDKILTRDILLRFIRHLSWEEFKPLVELWWLYCREVPFLRMLLEKNPDFLAPVARMLVKLDGPLNLRWEFLAEHETELVKSAVRRYRQAMGDVIVRDELEENLLGKMRSIERYDHLVPGSTFNQDRFQKYKLLILGRRIKSRIGSAEKGADQTTKRKLVRMVFEYLEAGPESKDLLDLQSLLDRKKVFDTNELNLLHLKFRIQYEQASFNDMIDEIEVLRQSVSMVKEESMPIYINILLLLADAYEASKLVTVADSTLRGIQKIDPHNPDIWFRLVRIQKILGDEDPQWQKQLEEKTDELRRSRFLVVEQPDQRFPVYLLDSKEMVISVKPDLINRVRNKKIVQIFVDSTIKYEAYLKDLPDPIRLTVVETGEMVKVEVEVKFL